MHCARSIGLGTVLALVAVGAGDAAAEPCSVDKLREVREPATSSRASVRIDCDLTLASTDVVTKRLILEGPSATGVTVDCRGAQLDGGDGRVNVRKDMIEIRSRRSGPEGDRRWERPENVTVRNCEITGSVRIWGMAKNGEGTDLRDSSRRAGHITRARNNAPRRITLDELTVRGVGRTPLYIAPGVTRVTLTNSEITGRATSVGVYLDTESGWNVLRNNYFHTTSRKEYAGGIYVRKREELAIDNSSYNEIINNRFSTLEGGGIYLYRNCGEGGTVRHATPSHNKIINNVFFYRRYDGDNPAIYIGSRDNSFWEGRWYCGDDGGYAWGSSADDRSFARYNVVMQNQIYVRSVRDMIKQGDSSNRPNYIDYNQTVTTESTRLAGCYVPWAYKDFLLNGQVADVAVRGNGDRYCLGYGLRCDDGRLRYAASSDCSIRRRPFDCRASGNDRGCSGVARCPTGTRIVGAHAACNLEYGDVSAAALDTVPVGTVDVVRASDNTGDGLCTVHGTSLRSGDRALEDTEDRGAIGFSCRERDKNGGDCHVRGALYCR